VFSSMSTRTPPVARARWAAVAGASASALTRRWWSSLKKCATRGARVQADRESRPEVEASKRRLDDLRGLTQLEETNVFVTVRHGSDCQPAQLSYMLREHGRPRRARAASRRSDVSRAHPFAVVTQASGEDWDHAELTFSTQRPPPPFAFQSSRR
jgi:hypothetical protein